MEVNVQLKTADGSVASSLGFESQVDEVVKGLGLRMYPRYPGTQDSIQGTLFRIPVEDAQSAQRVIDALRAHDGVQSASSE
jgi:hypothetical protein